MQLLLSKTNVEQVLLYWLKTTLKLQFFGIMLLLLFCIALLQYHWNSSVETTQTQVVETQELLETYQTKWIQKLSREQFLMRSKGIDFSTFWVIDPNGELLKVFTVNESKLLNFINHYLNLILSTNLLLFNLVIFALLYRVQVKQKFELLKFTSYSLVLYFVSQQSNLGDFVQWRGNYSYQFSARELTVSLASLLLIASFCLNQILRLTTRIKQLSSKVHLITYASQSGTAMTIANGLVEQVRDFCDIKSLNELSPNCLAGYQNILVVASTYGAGHPPENTRSFVKQLENSTQNLSKSRIAILALGDTSYQHFCAFGHRLNQQFKQKGALELLPIKEIHQAHEPSIIQWCKDVSKVLKWNLDISPAHWITSRLVAKHCINPKQPNRQVNHLFFDKKDRQLTNYRVGDLLEVLPQQDTSKLSQRIIELGWNPEHLVIFKGTNKKLIDILISKQWSQETAASPHALVEKLSDITPRVYSIVSTPNDKNIEVFVRRHIDQQGVEGLASGYLSRLKVTQKALIRIRGHDSFRPTAGHIPMIMIAAGTGIAPFISFMRERIRLKQSAPCWLIFGERSALVDNYFTEELMSFKQNGCLEHLDLTYSRCHKNPQYVSERLNQNSRQIIHWLDKGAHIYVCGNRRKIGQSVESTLSKILNTQWKSFKSSPRWHTDLY